MRALFLAVVVALSITVHANRCDVTGEYRCRGGRTGTVLGQGSTIEEAKINARDRARDICGGRVDYIRFIESSR